MPDNTVSGEPGARTTAESSHKYYVRAWACYYDDDAGFRSMCDAWLTTLQQAFPDRDWTNALDGIVVAQYFTHMSTQGQLRWHEAQQAGDV
jgi:hypothetical protein